MSADKPHPDWRVSTDAEKPTDFDASHWLVLKSAAGRVQARHIASGQERKLPKSWFE